MNKIVVGIVILAILGIGLYWGYTHWEVDKGEKDNLATWKEFIPRSGLFRVLLPNSPQYGKDFINVPNSDKKRRYDMYASEQIDGTLFLINVITYPPEVDTSSVYKILHQNLDELIHHKPDNQLTTLSKNTFESHDTLDFSFTNKEFNVEGRSIYDDHIVYMLIYIARKENFDLTEYDYFVNSFHLRDENGREKVKQKTPNSG